MFVWHEKSYDSVSGSVSVKIYYELPVDYNATLDFDVIDEVELCFGYEDEDQLTFYPNKCVITIDDERQENYRILKRSLSRPGNTLPENFFKYGGVDIKVNGILKFKGYIDAETLQYDDETMQVTFDVIDSTMALRDMNVDRDKIIDTEGNRIGDNIGITLTYPLYGIFKQIWNDFTGNIWDISSLNSGFYGTFIRHNWKATGIRYTNDTVTKDWSNINDFANTFFNFDSMGVFGEDRPCRTWTDFMKMMAVTFGAVIGVAGYGKIYFAKRFTNASNAIFNVNDKMLESPRLSVHMKALRGIVIHNHWNGDRNTERGIVERTPNGDFKYQDRVLELDTYVGSYSDGNNRGTCIYAGSSDYPVFAGFADPELNISGKHIYEIMADWYMAARKTPVQKIECTLEGTDYDMVSLYEYSPEVNSQLRIVFRPMTMKQKLFAGKTEIVGIESKLIL